MAAAMGKCVTLNGRHVWEKAGLLTAFPRATAKRVCYCCGAEKTVPIKL